MINRIPVLRLLEVGISIALVVAVVAFVADMFGFIGWHTSSFYSLVGTTIAALSTLVYAFITSRMMRKRLR